MKTIFVLAAIAASLSVTPGFAQSADRQFVVRHADLDLTSAAGRATLDLRLLHAARTACGTPSPADALGVQRADACVADLTAAAAPQRAALIASAEREARTRLASR